MANKLYEEKDVARIAKRINSYTGENKAYKLSEMADGVDEAVRVGDISTGVLKGLIERSLTELNIPLGTTRIGSYAFEAYSALTKITIPETVTKILNHAFHDCRGLTDIVIPDSVTEIGVSLFHGCNNLASVRLSDGIEILSANCFYQCSKLAKVTLPASLKKLEGSSLATTENGIFDFTKCEVVPVLASGAFLTLTDAAMIYVPTALYNQWIKATNWAALSDHIVPVYNAPEIPDPGYVSEGLEIGFDEFAGAPVVMGRGTCTNSVIVIPDECAGIGTEAFINDKTVDTVILPQHDCSFYADCFLGSTLRVIKNFTRIGGSLSLSGADNLKIVSFIDGAVIENYDFYYLFAQGITYDFTRCTSVVNLTDPEYITVDEDTRILVPVSLYGEWIKATNWAVYADKIYPAK